ncbi:MAG TPA: hypothetical protein PK668_07250 [Myxococcota bacterium]|nr:hypothetical protein [Myxococcota bacterium]HRY92358.1 hypothetical protein [Myxococcota bacterium]
MHRTLSLSLVLTAVLAASPASADPKADLQASCVDIARYLDMGDFDDLWRLSQADADSLWGRVQGCLKAASALPESEEVELQGFKKAGKPWIGKVEKVKEICVRVGGWAFDLKNGGKLHWAAVAEDKLRDEKYAEQMKEIADACIAFAGELKKNNEIADIRFSLNPENSLLMARSVQDVFCDDLREKAVKYLNNRPDGVQPERLELVSKTRPGAVTEALMRKIEPRPGVEVVKPMKPDWCPSGRIDAAGEYQVKEWNERVEKSWDVSELRLRQIALYACANPDDPGWQQQIAYWRQLYLNGTRTTEAFDRAALKARADEKAWDEQQSKTCDVVEALPDKTPEQKATRAGYTFVFACDRSRSPEYYPSVNNSLNPAMDLGWWLDARPGFQSHLLMAAWIKSCYVAARKFGDAGDASCMLAFREDAPALDAEKALAEAAALGFTNGYARTRVQELVTSAKAEQPLTDEVFSKWFKQNAPALAKAFFEVPDKAYARWKTHYAAHRALHERRLALDARIFDPGADAKGTTREAHALLIEVLQKSKLDDLKSMEAMGFDPVLSPFVYTLVLATRREEATSVYLGFYRMLKGLKGDFRGPRTAAFYAAFSTLVDLERSGKQPLESRFLMAPAFPPYDAKLAWGYGDEPTPKDQYNVGQVTKVVKGPGAAQVTVHFKSHKFEQDIIECIPTNQIEQFLPDGRIQYRQNCKHLGSYMKEFVPAPAAIPAELAKPIKPGMFLDYDHATTGKGTYTGDKDECFPAVLYADKSLKKVLQFHGIPVRK